MVRRGLLVGGEVLKGGRRPLVRSRKTTYSARGMVSDGGPTAAVSQAVSQIEEHLASPYVKAAVASTVEVVAGPPGQDEGATLEHSPSSVVG